MEIKGRNGEGETTPFRSRPRCRRPLKNFQNEICIFCFIIPHLPPTPLPPDFFLISLTFFLWRLSLVWTGSNGNEYREDFSWEFFLEKEKSFLNRDVIPGGDGGRRGGIDVKTSKTSHWFYFPPVKLINDNNLTRHTLYSNFEFQDLSLSSPSRCQFFFFRVYFSEFIRFGDLIYNGN